MDKNRAREKFVSIMASMIEKYGDEVLVEIEAKKKEADSQK